MELLTRPTLYPQPAVIESADATAQGSKQRSCVNHSDRASGRIETARCGLLAASHARGIDYPIADEAVTNLLADLRHFCAARRIDFDRCARLAEYHFETDIAGGAS